MTDTVIKRIGKARKYWRAALPILIGAAICLIPSPGALRPEAWYFFALFVGVIVALALEPIPGSVVGIAGITVATVLRLVEPGTGDAIRWAISGFSNATVWLIFAAFIFVLGYEKSGLGRRIALMLVRRLGKRTLGLGYAIAISDLVLAPFIPSNTARSGGMLFPVIRNIPRLYGSEPGASARKIGSYLMWTAFAATCVTSSMFLTAMAPNLLAVTLVNTTTDITITWSDWFFGFLPAGLLIFALVPLATYVFYPPSLKQSEEVPVWAAQELQAMGSIRRDEVLMALLALTALLLWILGGNIVHPTTVALMVLCLMILSGIVSWDDVLGHKQAWNVLVWFATLVAMADGLRRVGFLEWFAAGAADSLKGASPSLVVPLIVAAFFLIHYMFASLTAHVTALLPVFLAAAVTVQGVPPEQLSLMLCYCIGMMGIVTPYATGPAPVYYASGFINRKDFWVLGFWFGMAFLIIYLAICIPYLRVP